MKVLNHPLALGRGVPIGVFGEVARGGGGRGRGSSQVVQAVTKQYK